MGVSGKLHAPAALLLTKNPEPGWTVLENRKYLAPTKIRTPGRSSPQLVTSPTTLSRLTLTAYRGSHSSEISILVPQDRLTHGTHLRLDRIRNHDFTLPSRPYKLPDQNNG